MGGGGKRHPYPKYVWSPIGGYWSQPRHWKRNTFYCILFLLGSCACVGYISAQLERRPVPPCRHIPSQRWCKYAKIDDPSLP